MHLLTPDRELMTDMDATKAQLGEPVNFIGVTYWNMGEELLTGTEMTDRQLHRQGPHIHM